MGNFDVEKTIVVPDSGGTGNNFLAGMLAPACQSKGLDANAVMALCGNRNGSFGNGWDGIIALIVIAAIFGGNGNGLFGNNNNSTERQMLMVRAVRLVAIHMSMAITVAIMVAGVN